MYRPFLPVSKNIIKAMCNKYGTPLQIYDEKSIIRNSNNFFSVFRKYFANFDNYFAVKALPNPNILKLLIENGHGLDCSSISELYISELLKNKKTIYTSNFTSKKDLKYALDKNILINLDDISHIDTILQIQDRMPYQISFRLNPGIGNTNLNQSSNILAGPNAKFGVDKSQIIDCYKFSKKNGSNSFGIHMMTGSCVKDIEYWGDIFRELLLTICDIKKEVNIDFDFINIGGGLGIPYKENENILNLEELVKELYNVKESIDIGEVFPRLCMENGRYITGPYGWLVSTCESIKNIPNHKYIGLDSCMSNLMRPGMYNSYHHISTIKNSKDKYENEKKEIVNVVGTLCENNDWFAKDRELPFTEIGDYVVIHDTGAHSHSMGFQYNGKLRAPEVLIDDYGNDKLIRKREKIEDLYSNIVFS